MTVGFSFGKRMNPQQGYRSPHPGPPNEIEDETQACLLHYPGKMLMEDVKP